MTSIMKSIRWCLLCFLLFATVFSNTESNASSVTGLVEGSSEYLRFLHIEPDYVLVGAKNSLYNISTVTMDVQATYQWLPSERDVENCQTYITFYKNCDSYVRSVQKESETNFTVCASSAKTPICRTLSYTSSGWKLEGSVYPLIQMVLAPVFPWEELVLYKTAENIVHVGTYYYRKINELIPVLFRTGFTEPDGTEYSAMSSAMQTTSEMSAINFDQLVGLRPQFTKIFESQEHVYLLFSEPAREMYSIQKVIYSRVARVCKNDRSNPLARSFDLITFFKARLLCGFPEVELQNDNQRNSTRGQYSYYFDHLVAASELRTDPASGEQMLVAAFNSPSNIVGGSAICMYKLSDIAHVFNTSPAVNQIGYTTLPLIKNKPPARCHENPNNISVEESQEYRHPLLKDPVNAVDRNTLFVQAGTNYKMTQMVVDWEVRGPDGISRTVIFVSTDNGKLLKLANFKKEGEKEARYHLIEEREIFPGQEITGMRLIKESSGKKHLLLSTHDNMKRVAVEKCHRYDTCFVCAALRDPYCSWSSTHDSCVSTSHSARDKVQSVETGKLEECEAYSTLAPSVEVNNEDDLSKKPSILGTGRTSKQVADDGQRTVYIVLLITIPLLTLAIGIGIGIAVHAYKNRRPHISHLEDALKAKNCKQILDRQDSDAYQDLPNTLYKTELQYKNNLVKTISDPYEPLPPASPSEATLARTKKSYV